MNPTPEKTSVMAPFILMLFLYFIVGLFTVINQQFQVPLKSALLPSSRCAAATLRAKCGSR